MAEKRDSDFRMLLRLCRAEQWTKNLLVFAGLIFAQRLADPGAVLQVSVVFAAFCLLSSGLYIFNDLADLEKDRLSETKRTRPVASSAVSTGDARLVGLVLLACGLFLAFLNGPWPGVTAVAFAAVTIAYSAALKHLVVLDVLALSSGYVLRAVAGAVAIPVAISPWLLICTLLLAMFLATGKRRQELALSETAHAHRPVLMHYSVALLDQMTTILAAATLVAYCVYTASPQTLRKFSTPLMPLTIPFVLYGLFRYLYLVHKRARGHDPSEVLLTDGPLLVCVLLWGLSCIAIIALARL